MFISSCRCISQLMEVITYNSPYLKVHSTTVLPLPFSL